MSLRVQAANFAGMPTRVFSILSIWILAVGIGAGGLLASSSKIEEIVAFGLHFALTSAIASASTLIVAGKWRLGREILFSVLVFSVCLAIVAYLLLWPAAVPLRAALRLRAHDVLRLRHMAWEILRMLASPISVIGIGGAMLTGIIFGLLMRMKNTVVAGLIGMTLLLGLGGSFSDLSAALVDLVVHYRLDGGNWKVSSVTVIEMASAIGAATGSMIGATIACIALRMDRPEKGLKNHSF